MMHINLITNQMARLVFSLRFIIGFIAVVPIVVIAQPQTEIAINLQLGDLKPGVGDSDPAGYFWSGSRLYFMAKDATNTVARLWSSEGTAESSVPVTLSPGGLSVRNVQSMVLANDDNTYLTADVGSEEIEVLRLAPGSASATILTNLNGVASSAPTKLTTVGNSLYYMASNGVGQARLWHMSAYGSPVQPVTNAANGSAITNAQVLASVNGHLYFAANGQVGPQNISVWRASGTAAFQITNVVGTSGFRPELIYAQSNRLFMSVSDPGENNFPPLYWLFVDPATGIATGRVYQINQVTAAKEFTAIGSLLLFSGSLNDGLDFPAKLWQVSLANAGETNLVPEIRTNSVTAVDFRPRNLSRIADLTYMTGTDISGNDAVWVHSATGGLIRLRVFGSSGSLPANGQTGLGNVFVPALTEVYFSGIDAGGTQRLWKAVGDQVVLLNDQAGRDLWSPGHLLSVGPDIYYSSRETTSGREPWRLVRSINVRMGELLSPPNGLTNAPVDIQSYTGSGPKGAVWISRASGLLFTEPSYTLRVRWSDNTTNIYFIKNEAVKEKVRIYHTEGFSKAPLVDVSAIPYGLVIHGNSKIRATTTNTIITSWPVYNSSNQLIQTITISNQVIIQGNVWVGDDKKLHADKAEGPVVIHYESPESYGGVEVIDVYSYSSDGQITNLLGNELLPVSATNRADKAAQHAYVARGKQNRRTDDGYIYQHADQGLYNGKIYAVRESTNTFNNMEVFWMRNGLHGVAWPYEMNRFQAKWPEGQRFLRSPGSTFPRVEMPEDINPFLMPEEKFTTFGAHGFLNGNEFYTDGEGLSLLMFESGPAARRDWLGFQVVRSIWHTNNAVFTNRSFVVANFNLQTNIIGDVITNNYHEGPRRGYIRAASGTKYHESLYGERDRFDMPGTNGHIFAVNRGGLEVWWSNMTLTNKNDHLVDFPGIQWPSYAVRYTNVWPVSPSTTIDIKDSVGTGPLTDTNYPGWSLYYQNDPTLIGFNPNDEHAVVLDSEGGLGPAIFALRNDLNDPNTSEPYVLITHNDLVTGKPDVTVFKVNRSNLFYDKPEFTAGKLVAPPFALAQLPMSTNTYFDPTPAAWRDRKASIWAIAANPNSMTGTTDIVMRYFYKNQTNVFYWPTSYVGVVRENMPWLDKGAGTIGIPMAATNRFRWPDAPVMQIAQTLTKPTSTRSLTNAFAGLPEVWGQTAAEIVYMQSTNQSINSTNFGSGPSVALIDPLWTREVTLAALPTDVTTLPKAGVLTFDKLPAYLRERFVYRPGTPNKLQYRGLLVEPASGLRYLLPNIMTDRERDEILKLSSDVVFSNAVMALYETSSVPRFVKSNDPKEKLALIPGVSNGWGFVTIAFNNSTNFNRDADPISVEVIFVTNSLYKGEIKIIDSDNIFDEKLTLRHSSDFAGKSGNFEFQWKYDGPNALGMPPALNETQGLNYPLVPVNGFGALDVTVATPPLPDAIIVLSDNYFVTRYRSRNPNSITGTNWSEWTGVALAEGWIKRVTRGINPYDQRYLSFAQNRSVNTLVSMVSQAGAAYEGNVALNSEVADTAGLIEIYRTVIDRGSKMSIGRGLNYGPANDALIFVASRIADLYMVLGNEAYADALNPTIGFGTDGGDYGSAATAIHCFMNQTATLLEEELKLLRGRDDSLLPYYDQGPYYNRLVWNMSSAIAGGEVAYVLNYEIADVTGANGNPDPDGFIDENDAKEMYPQAHGDAWGHYLSAAKDYYGLLGNTNFIWLPRIEAVTIGGQPVNVDYYDERKFASIAAARARTGLEIVSLTHRQKYDESVDARWSGYKDVNTNRAWGVSDWAKRANQGAYWDWLIVNSMLPVEPQTLTVTNFFYTGGETNAVVRTNETTGLEFIDLVITNQILSNNVVKTAITGIGAIDRTSVVELQEIAATGIRIQDEMDKADMGLNPLGLVDSVVPFDIDPSGIDQGRTHFEQIYDRAVQALANAGTVFNKAQESSQRLRKQFDSVQEFDRNIREREFDFNNRLIEIFGTPYPDDIGPTGYYPTGYDGPDYVHFDYFEPSGPLNVDDIKEITTNLSTLTVNPLTGGLKESVTSVVFHISSTAFGLVKPPYWTKGNRRAVGEIQTVRSDLVQAKSRFDRSLMEYDNLLNQIDDQVFLLAEQKGLNKDELRILNRVNNQQKSLNNAIARSRAKQQDFRRVGSIATIVANAAAEIFPTTAGFIVGFSNGVEYDIGSAARGAVRLVGAAVNEVMSAKADAESLVELDKQQAKEIVSAQSNIEITTIRGEYAVDQQIRQLGQLVRQEALTRLDLYTQQEVIRQIIGRYSSALARGERLLDERLRFRKQTAGVIQDYRYKDMAFRIFRDEALQKYRAQFDLAAMYVFMAARAYDYETNFREGDPRGPGRNFMRQIVKARAIGELFNNTPTTSQFDGGLADPMARMTLNWSVLKGQLGFNNPQTETGRFSLRSELFRIHPGSAGDAVWRETLKRNMVDNILDMPEFQRYCLPFYPQQAAEPGIVIEFPTTINFAHNFFGWLAGGGDNSYDSANFATKVRSVGLWFANYNNVVGNGMVNTPRAYLVPVGSDVMRSPTDYTGEISEWTVMDQVLPIPFPLSGADLNNPSWIPMFDSLYGQFAAIRKHGSIRAYHDSGTFNQAETISNSRLIGRSVWNTRWMLIIPAGTLHSDRKEGLARFIDGSLVNGQRDGNGVKDIKLFFQTYAFEGL